MYRDLEVLRNYTSSIMPFVFTLHYITIRNVMCSLVRGPPVIPTTPIIHPPAPIYIANSQPLSSSTLPTLPIPPFPIRIPPHSITRTGTPSSISGPLRQRHHLPITAATDISHPSLQTRTPTSWTYAPIHILNISTNLTVLKRTSA